MVPLRYTLAFFTLPLLWSSFALAGNTTCVDSSVTWWNGKNGENPCLMYERLMRICDSDFQMYSTQAPPLYDTCRTSCCCSSVAYALQSACWSCQWGPEAPANPESYSTFIQCSNASAPGTLPSDYQQQLSKVLPDWTFIPYTSTDIWSYAVAKAKALGITTSTTTSASNIAIASRTPSPTATSTSSNIAPIVGGVVGGIGGIAIGILLGFLWFKRVQRRDATANNMKAQGFQPGTFGGHQVTGSDGMPLVPHRSYGTPPPFRPSGSSPMEGFTTPPPPSRPGTRVKNAVAPTAVKRYEEGHRSPLPPPSTNPPSSQTQSPPASHGQRPSETMLSSISPGVRYEQEEDAGLVRQTADGGVEVVRLPPAYRDGWFQG